MNSESNSAPPEGMLVEEWNWLRKSPKGIIIAMELSNSREETCEVEFGSFHKNHSMVL